MTLKPVKSAAQPAYPVTGAVGPTGTVRLPGGPVGAPSPPSVGPVGPGGGPIGPKGGMPGPPGPSPLVDLQAMLMELTLLREAVNSHVNRLECFGSPGWACDRNQAQCEHHEDCFAAVGVKLGGAVVVAGEL